MSGGPRFWSPVSLGCHVRLLHVPNGWLFASTMGLWALGFPAGVLSEVLGFLSLSYVGFLGCLLSPPVGS